MTTKVRFVGSGDAFGSGGRFQTCILVESPGITFTMDFGTSSLIALKQQGLRHNDIDVVLLTHLHGDHCGGVPFLLMDAMLGAKRQAPLTIAGPQGTEQRLHEISEALFPGMHVMTPKFPLEYVELQAGVENRIRDLAITPRYARHTWQTNPTALRVEVNGKIVAYTGDSEFTDEMAKVGHNADLLVAECYYHTKPIRWHLNYPVFKERQSEFRAKRIILTHMSPEMLAQTDAVPEQCAYDGLTVEL